MHHPIEKSEFVRHLLDGQNEGWLDDPFGSGRSQDQADEEMKDAARDDDMLAEFAQD